MKVVVLVAEDEPELRDAITGALKNEGYEVLEAENGKTALEIINQQQIHIVLSDLTMPGGSGIELLSNIEKLERKPIVIMMTGFSDLTEAEVQEKGATALLAKPFNTPSLINIVAKYALSVALASQSSEST